MSGSTYLQNAPNCIGNENHGEMIQTCEISSPSSLSLSSNSCSTKNASPGLIAESFTYSTKTPKEDQQLKFKSFDENEEMSKETRICPASPFVKDTAPQGEKNYSMALICDNIAFQKDDSTSLPSKVEDDSGAKAQYDLGRKEFVNGSINVFERKAEIEPSLYAPIDYAETQNMKSPIIHRLSLQNRPLHMRKSLSIHEVFQNPVTLLWKRKFEKFNVLQSEIAPILVNSNDTIVLSAPTGSGKTGVFEIAIASHIIKDLKSMRENSMNWQCKQLPICRKIVYLSPSKALCEERYDDWTSRLSSLKLGIRTAMITGDDSEPGEAFREISQSHLIITTPERWDSLTRRWTENFVLFGSIKLLLIDEVHLLGDPSRGSCIESVICRMKTIFRATQSGKIMESQILTSRSVLWLLLIFPFPFPLTY
jgi:superfamily II helicase